MRLELYARDPAILLVAEIVALDPPLPERDWADIYWIRRDTWVCLACKTVFHGDPGPEIEMFLYGMPAERTRWVNLPWHEVPLEIGTEYLLGLEPARERAKSKRRPTFQPGDFDSLPRLASSRPSLVTSVREIVAVEHAGDLEARLAQQLRWLDDPDLEKARYAARAVVARWRELEDQLARAELETAIALALLREDLRAQVLEQLDWTGGRHVGDQLAEALLEVLANEQDELTGHARSVLVRSGWLTATR
jgi:hypothetical protein